MAELTDGFALTKCVVTHTAQAYTWPTRANSNIISYNYLKEFIIN